MKTISVALPKGRLGEKVYNLLEKAGYGCSTFSTDSRKLIFESDNKKMRFFWVKPTDVTVYVERGAADVGVCGRDTLVEHAPDVYVLHDLGIGVCKMAVAAPNDFVENPDRPLRVATKFPKIASDFYAKKSRDIDIIKLNGSIEIAPLLGLSDVIVDLVETGKTLVENGLKVYEDVMPISARLIANKSGYQFNTAEIDNLILALKGE